MSNPCSASCGIQLAIGILLRQTCMAASTDCRTPLPQQMTSLSCIILLESYTRVGLENDAIAWFGQCARTWIEKDRFLLVSATVNPLELSVISAYTHDRFSQQYHLQVQISSTLGLLYLSSQILYQAQRSCAAQLMHSTRNITLVQLFGTSS